MPVKPEEAEGRRQSYWGSCLPSPNVDGRPVSGSSIRAHAGEAFLKEVCQGLARKRDWEGKARPAVVCDKAGLVQGTHALRQPPICYTDAVTQLSGNSSAPLSVQWCQLTPKWVGTGMEGLNRLVFLLFGSAELPSPPSDMLVKTMSNKLRLLISMKQLA